MSLEPEYKSSKFQCPSCGVASQQTWFDESNASSAANTIMRHIFYDYRGRIQGFEQEIISDFLNQLEEANKRHMGEFVPPEFSVARCSACDGVSLWVRQVMVYPKPVTVAPPNGDLSEEIQSLYLEASEIVASSPKGAAALLRMAVQLLMIQLGQPGKNINDDIKQLVADGLSPKIQKALDLVRVVGNNAVHPGQITLDETSDVALKLFHLINLIAEELITRPKEIDSLYSEVVPESSQRAIENRDGHDSE